VEDCNLVLVSHIGPGAVNLLKQMGIDAQIGEGPVDSALDKLQRFRKRFMGSRPEITGE
jgi:predicted Fe-Mo cluster-binding NifX family protein